MKCVVLAVLMVVSTINGWPTEDDLIEGGLQQTAQSEDFGHLEYLPGGNEYLESSQFYGQKEEKSHRRQNSGDFQKSDNSGLNAQHASYRSREAENQEFRRIHSLNQDQIHVPSGGFRRNIQLDQIARSADKRSYSDHQSNELRVKRGHFLQPRSGFQSKNGREDYRRSEDQFLQHGAGSAFRDSSAIKSVESAHRRYNSENTEEIDQQAFDHSDVINDDYQVPSFIENKKPRPVYYNQKPNGPAPYQRPKTFPSPLLRVGEKQNYGNDFIENEPDTYVRETKRFAAIHRNTGPSQPRITVLRNNDGFNKGIVSSKNQERELEMSTKEYIDKALKEAEEAKKYAKVIANKLTALKTSFDKDLHKVNVVEFADNSQNFENPTDKGDQVKVVEFADNSNSNLGNDGTVQDYPTETGNENGAPVFQTPYYLPYGKFVNNPRYKDLYPNVVTKPNYGPFLDYPVHVRKGFIPHRVGGSVNVVEKADNSQNFENPNNNDDKVKVVDTADNSQSLPNVNDDKADKVQVVENAVNNNDQDKIKVVEQAENQDDGQQENFVNNNPGDVSNNGLNVEESSASNPSIQEHDNSHLLRPYYLPHGKFENHPRYKDLYPSVFTKPNYGPFLDYPVHLRKGFIPRRIGGGVTVVENADNSQTIPNVNDNADKVNVVENANNNNEQDKVKVVDLVISQDDLEKAKSVNNNKGDGTNSGHNGVNVVESPAGNQNGIWNQDNSHLLRDNKPVNENASTDVPNNGENVPDFKRPSNNLPYGKFLNNPRYKNVYPTVATKPTFAPLPVQARDGIPLVNTDEGAPGFMASPSNLNEDPEYPETVQNAYKSRPKYNGFRPYRPYNKNYLKNGPVISNSYYRNPPNFLPNQAVNGPTTIVGGPATGLQRPDISPVFADVIAQPDGTYIPNNGNNANLPKDNNVPENVGIVKPVEEKLPQEIVPTVVNRPTSDERRPMTGFETPDISPVFADVIKLPDGTYVPIKGNNADLLRTNKAPESEAIVKPVVEKLPQDSTSVDNTKPSVIVNTKQDSNPVKIETPNEVAPKNNEPADNKDGNIVEPTTILGDGPTVTGFQKPDISPTFIDVIVQPDGTLIPSQENNGESTNDSEATPNEGSLGHIIEKQFPHILHVPANENASSTQENNTENKEDESSPNNLSSNRSNDESQQEKNETTGNKSTSNLNDVTNEENKTLTKRSSEDDTANNRRPKRRLNRSSGVPNVGKDDRIIRTFVIEEDADGHETIYEKDVIIKGNFSINASKSSASSASASPSSAKSAPRSGPVSTVNTDEKTVGDDFNLTEDFSANANEPQDIMARTRREKPTEGIASATQENNTENKEDESSTNNLSSNRSNDESQQETSETTGNKSTSNLNDVTDEENKTLTKRSSEDDTANNTRPKRRLNRSSGVPNVGKDDRIVRTFVIEEDADGHETIYEKDVIIKGNFSINASKSSASSASASPSSAKSAPRSGPVSTVNTDEKTVGDDFNLTEDFSANANEPQDIMARTRREKPTVGIATRKHKKDKSRKHKNINTGTTESINFVNELNKDTKVEIDTKSRENVKASETNHLDEASDKKGSKDRVKHKKSKRKHRKGNKQNENDDNYQIESTKPNTETAESKNDKPKTNDETDIIENVKTSEDQSTVSQDTDVLDTGIKHKEHKSKYFKAPKVKKSKKKHSKRNKGQEITSSDNEDSKNDDKIRIGSTQTDEIEQSSEKKEKEAVSEDDQSTRVENVSDDKKVKRKHGKRSKSEKLATSRRHKKDKKSRKDKNKQNIEVTEKEQEESKTITNEESTNDQDKTIKSVDDVVGRIAKDTNDVKDKSEKDSNIAENSSITTSDGKADDSKTDESVNKDNKKRVKDTSINVKDESEKDIDTTENASVKTSEENGDESVNKDFKKKKPSDVNAGKTKGDEKEVKIDENSKTKKTDDLKNNENGKEGNLSESQIIRKITRYYKLLLPKRHTIPKKVQSNIEKDGKSDDSSKSKETKEKSNKVESSSTSAKSDNEKNDSTNEESLDENVTNTKSKKHHLRSNTKHHKGKNSKNVEKDSEVKSSTGSNENNDSGNDNSESNSDVEESNKTKFKKSKKPKHSERNRKNSKLEIDENVSKNTEQNDNEENDFENSESRTQEELSKAKESRHSKVHKIKSRSTEEIKTEEKKTSENSETNEQQSSKSEPVETATESYSVEQQDEEETTTGY